MITAKSKNGISRRLIYNEVVLLVDSEDVLSFHFIDSKLSLELTFNFTFSDSGEELKTSGDVSDDGKIINMTLHKWSNPLGVELTTPIELQTNQGKTVWVKFRTSSEKSSPHRSFHLTIWGEE